MSVAIAPRAMMSLRRAAARAVDAFTVFFLAFGLAVTVLFAVMAPLTDALDVGPWGRSLAPALLTFVVGVAYETVFVATRGQTPGRDLANVKVVDSALPSAGTSPVEPWPAWARAVFGWSVVLIPDLRVALVVLAIGLLALALDPAGRSVLDRLVGTRVISYDADVEEGPIVSSRPADELDERYGPRLWRSLTGSMGATKP